MNKEVFIEIRIRFQLACAEACLKSKEQSYGLQAVLSTINIVSQEQIVNITETEENHK